MTNIEKRLTNLETKGPQALPALIRAHLGESPEAAEARWRAEHPDRAGEPVNVIVHTIVDPPARQSANTGR